MGGHAYYVWLAYGLTLLLILGNTWYARVSRRNFFRQHAQRQMRRGRKGTGRARRGQDIQDEEVVEL